MKIEMCLGLLLSRNWMPLETQILPETFPIYWLDNSACDTRRVSKPWSLCAVANVSSLTDIVTRVLRLKPFGIQVF